jgi:hypothetical protein
LEDCLSRWHARFSAMTAAEPPKPPRRWAVVMRVLAATGNEYA